MKGKVLGRNFKLKTEAKVQIEIKECLMHNGKFEETDYQTFITEESKVLLLQANSFQDGDDMFIVDTGFINAVFKGKFSIIS